MTELDRLIYERRSIRKFKAEVPPKELVDEVVKAGLLAPTGRNQGSTFVIRIDDPELRAEVVAKNAEIMGAPPPGRPMDPFYGAPVILAVIADKNAFTGVYDGSLVMGNLMNAAESLGIGSIWIHRAKEEFQSDFGKKLLADLGIEGDFEGIGHVALGYVDEGGVKPAAPRKENYVYWVK